MSKTFGAYVAAARRRKGASLREVSEIVGLSRPFIHDVEHGRRRLPPRHWPALVRILPTATLRGLALAAVAEGPVTLDASALTPEQRAALADALVAAAEAPESGEGS